MKINIIQEENNLQNGDLEINEISLEKKKFYDLKSFSNLRKVSISKLRRVIQIVPKWAADRFCRKFNGMWYVTDEILKVHPDFFSKKQSVRGSWEKFISTFEWDFFGTIRFNAEYKLSTARQRANSYYKKLLEKYKGSGVRLVYALENNFGEENGFHFHFLLWVDDDGKSEIQKFTEAHFRGSSNKYGNTRMGKYVPGGGAEKYILKEMRNHEDSVDFLYNVALGTDQLDK